MTRERAGLQMRVARHIGFAVILSLAISALVLVVFRYRSTRGSLEQAARTYASLIGVPVARLVMMYGPSGSTVIDQQVGRLFELNGDIIKLEVVTVNGEVLARSEHGEVVVYSENDVRPVIVDPDLLLAIRGLETTARRIELAGRGAVYRVVAPAVEEWGRHAYSLVATFSYSRLDLELRKALLLSGLVLAVGLGLTYRVSVTLARGITRDVKRLRSGVQRIREGHLDERVTVQSNDEIEELAEAFNAMADELLSTIHRLRDANRELEYLDQTKADLVANVSHELKTPLTALRGYLELMADGELGELGDDSVRAVDVCRRNVRRLSLRIDELVQLSNLDRYLAVDAAREHVDVTSLLEGVLATFRPRLEEAQINCYLEIEPGVTTVAANQEQIERVFLNLLDNAVKFTAEGDTVLVGAKMHDHEGREGVLFRVQDSGIGVSPSDLVRIFDRFYQVDPSARRRFGGMGLGLALVRSIVESHKGTVWAESEEGIGSTFYVWLPCQGSGIFDIDVAKLEEGLSTAGQSRVAREEGA